MEMQNSLGKTVNVGKEEGSRKRERVIRRRNDSVNKENHNLYLAGLQQGSG